MIFSVSGRGHAPSHDDSADSSIGRTHPRTRTVDRVHVGGRAPSGAEANAGREALPADPEHVPGSGRQDHRNVARDRQLGARPHA